MKFRFFTIFITFITLQVFAVEDVSIPSSFNPVGSGARAMGMGGAFIAMADDATAASWNPSALIQLRKPEIAVVYSYTSRNEDLEFEKFPDSNSSQSSSSSDLNYFALSYPCSADSCGKNMVFSVNYQRLYDLNRSWNFSVLGDATNDKIAFNQEGSLNALGLAYAVQVTEDLSLGFTVNFWDDAINDNEWHVLLDSNENSLPGETPFTFQTIQADKYTFEGVNFNLGLLWEIFQDNEQKLTLGLTYKSEFDADIVKDRVFVTSQGNPTIPEDIYEQLIGPYTNPSTLTMPSSVGIGLAYQLSDNLTLSADLYQTFWEDFVFTEANGDQFSPISGLPIDQANIENTTQVRVGMEYRIISQDIGSNYIIPIRFGGFYDPAPSDNVNETIYGLTFGSGISYQHWVFDIAYQYRWANDMSKTTLPALGFSQDLQEHQVYGSVFYRF